ncbi:transglycosylase family protein [Actinacidiphila glaucinigra]|uniref:transglycosylase family protein n=1 Tax=Actinacidiphila glaucinigra TaxID=235986 RepID=UPI00366A5BD2
MLKSGNGRHRKPRQAPTAMVAVAATGAGLTLPLFAASGASAADANSTWNAVAMCESGGLWSSNTGNGFFGGLQITEETWQQYGGEQYAERPDLASRNEQISVAEKILAELGPDAWSGCADSSGLTDALDDLLHGGHGHDDQGSGDSTGTGTGDEDTDDGATSGDDSTGTTTPGTGDDTTATPDADPTTGPDASATPSAGDKGEGKGTGKHRKPEAGTATDGPATGDTTGSSGTFEHGPSGLPAHFVEGEAAWGVIPLSTDTRAETRKADTGRDNDASAKSTTGKRYLVQEGDSLCEIAMEQDVAGGWRGLYDANRDVIGDDPNAISPGSYLDLGR